MKNVLKRIVKTAGVICLLQMGVASAIDFKEKPALLTPTQLQAISSGKIVATVVGGKVGHGEVYAEIKAPPSKVWEVLFDYGSYRTWYPDMKESKIVSSNGDNRVTFARVDLPLMFEDRQFSLNALVANKPVSLNGKPVYLMQFDYLPNSGNVKAMYGYWVLYENPNKPNTSILKYVLNADIGVWLPKPLLTWAQSRMFPVMIRNLRAKVE